MIWAFFCIVTCLPAPSCFEPLSYIVQKVRFFSRTLLSLSLGDLQLPLIDVRFTLLLDCSLGLQITALQFSAEVSPSLRVQFVSTEQSIRLGIWNEVNRYWINITNQQFLTLQGKCSHSSPNSLLSLVNNKVVASFNEEFNM